jgi:membrane fusion protein (multidrug efflux system)
MTRFTFPPVAQRMLAMLVSVAAFLLGIGAIKYRQIQTAVANAASFEPPPEAVTTVIAREQPWPATLRAIGTVAPVQGVTVSADLPGVVAEVAFESGAAVKAGALLVRLDTRQEDAQLAAAEAQRELAALNLARIRDLRGKGVISQGEYDRAAAEHKQAEARSGEIRAAIQRKTIRAPFAGSLGLRQVNLGQYLDGGAPVVSLQSLQPIYVNFGVPQQQVGLLRVGGEVRVSAEGLPGQSVGRITAKDSVVDEATRNVQVQATFANAEGRLRPGMFVEARIGIGSSEAVIAVPASAVSYAPYGDSVFVVEATAAANGEPQRGVRQQFVKLGAARGDLVAIASGVKAGEEIVSSGVFKLRNGAAVQVNNKVQPGSDPAPRPEDK